MVALTTCVIVCRLAPETTAETTRHTSYLTTAATASGIVPMTVPGTVPPMISEAETRLPCPVTHHGYFAALMPESSVARHSTYIEVTARLPISTMN